MHINARLFNIHQRYALLAAGPRPHGSMRSLPRSFVWHRCRCLEHEIKLVTVIGNTYTAVNVVCACRCVYGNANFPRVRDVSMLFKGSPSGRKLMTRTQKFSQLFPSRWSIREKGREREEGASKGARWWQLCLGARNWVLIELAPKDEGMEGGIENGGVWVNWICSATRTLAHRSGECQGSRSEPETP